MQPLTRRDWAFVSIACVSLAVCIFSIAALLWVIDHRPKTPDPPSLSLAVTPTPQIVYVPVQRKPEAQATPEPPVEVAEQGEEKSTRTERHRASRVQEETEPEVTSYHNYTHPASVQRPVSTPTPVSYSPPPQQTANSYVPTPSPTSPPSSSSTSPVTSQSFDSHFAPIGSDMLPGAGRSDTSNPCKKHKGGKKVLDVLLGVAAGVGGGALRGGENRDRAMLLGGTAGGLAGGLAGPCVGAGAGFGVGYATGGGRP